jgi:hypothetical protein
MVELAVALCHALNYACANIISPYRVGMRRNKAKWWHVLLDVPSCYNISCVMIRRFALLPPRPAPCVYEHATSYVTNQTFIFLDLGPFCLPEEVNFLPLPYVYNFVAAAVNLRFSLISLIHSCKLCIEGVFNGRRRSLHYSKLVKMSKMTSVLRHTGSQQTINTVF